MEPCLEVSQEEFFHSSICGRFFGVASGRAVSGTGSGDNESDARKRVTGLSPMDVEGSGG